MQILQPEYYDRFHCLAGACPDSCCREWDVEIDEKTALRYRSLPGSLGDLLRQSLRDVDGKTVIVMKEGKCPMWRADGLCRVQAELGEEALSQICRDYPRLTHDYGDFRELGLELSCPEAARLILSAPSSAPICRELPWEETGDYDREAMAVLLSTRETMRTLLSQACRPVGQTLALALLYGCQAQGQLDGAEPFPFDPEQALEEAQALARPGDPAALLAFFRKLEILTPKWKALLARPVSGSWQPEHLALARYLVDRYWLQAVSDYDLYSRVKFLVIACLLTKHLPGPLAETAQLFSKEIENDADNVDAILDAAYTLDAFRDDRLLGLLLGN